MTDLITSADHPNEHGLTAAQVEQNCPVKLQDLGKKVNAHLTKAAQCEDKAEQHRVSAGQLLVEAKKACDDGGFRKFRELFCPQLGQSRVYELLAIATNKKSIEDIKAGTRERVAKHRANKANSVTVTEKPNSISQAEGTPTEGGNVEVASLVPEQTPEPAEPRGSVQTKDDALFGFTAHVRELIRRTTKRRVGRFAATAVAADDLAKLGKFLIDLADYKNSGALPDGGRAIRGPVSAEQSTEDMNAKREVLEGADDLAA